MERGCAVGMGQLDMRLGQRAWGFAHGRRESGVGGRVEEAVGCVRMRLCRGFGRGSRGRISVPARRPLVEDVVGDGFRIGRVERRRLVHVEMRVEFGAERGLGRCAGWRERWRPGGQTERVEYGANGLGLGDEGDDAELSAAGRTEQRRDLVDSCDQACPQGGVGALASG